MSKYNVGDKVTIRSDLCEDQNYGDTYCNDEMPTFGGTVCTVTKIRSDSSYKLSNAGGWDWCDEMLEDTIKNPVPISPKIDLKSIIKDFYRIKTRSGDFYIAFSFENADGADDFIFCQHGSWLGMLSEYDDELKVTGASDCNIVKIFKPPSLKANLLSSEYFGDLIVDVENYLINKEITNKKQVITSKYKKTNVLKIIGGCKFKHGTKVTVLDAKDEFGEYLVKSSEKAGYVKEENLTRI